MTNRPALDAVRAQIADSPTLTIVVPGTPPHGLSPNRRHNLPAGLISRLRQEMQHDWYYAALDVSSALVPPVFPGPTHCQITVYRGKGAKPWDADNLLAACKHGLDQLERVGIVANDNLLSFAPIKQERDPAGVGYTLVELTAMATLREAEGTR